MNATPLFCALAAAAALSPALAADSAAEDAPAKRLAYFIGTWKESGESRADQNQEFGKLSGSETCEWQAGKTAVLCRETTTDASGKIEASYLIGYDGVSRAYSLRGFDSTGMALTATGTIDGDRWTWIGLSNSPAGSMSMRFTFDLAHSPGRTMLVEFADRDGKWVKAATVDYVRK